MTYPPSEFLENLPNDTDDKIKEVLDHYDDYRMDSSEHNDFNIILRYYTALYAILDNEEFVVDEADGSHGFDARGYPRILELDFEHDEANLIEEIHDIFGQTRSRNSRILAARNFQRNVNETRVILGQRIYYQFHADEIEAIQNLINQLRKEISTSDIFEEDHRRRLLSRLEAVQKEMHKKMSDLDRFWGLIGDAGVTLGKFGSDAKPITDRIRDLMGIVWKAQARTEQIDARGSNPMLGAPAEEEVCEDL